LFWTIPIEPNSLQIELEEGRASMHMVDVAVPDTHDLANNLTNGHGLANPPIAPIAPVPATVSFDVKWSGVISRAAIVNEAQNFKGDFVRLAPPSNGLPRKTGSSLNPRSRTLRVTLVP
jgi:hypothetical protein